LEILRAGIQSIHGGQTQAAYSIGLTAICLVITLALSALARRLEAPAHLCGR